MKDDNGYYYYPYPSDTKTRVYVRKGASGPEFRLWRADIPAVWEKHQWRDWNFLQAEAISYQNRARNIAAGNALGNALSNSLDKSPGNPSGNPQGEPSGNPPGNPMLLYDLNVANALLKN